MHFRTRSVRRPAVTAVALSTAVGLLTACSQASTAPTQSTDPAVVTKAQALVEAAHGGLVGFTGDEQQITLDAMGKFDSWQGPPPGPAPKQGAKIDIVACNLGTSCEEIANKVADAAKELGWTVTIRDGQGSPEGFQKAMSTSIAAKPDAMVAVAIPESQVADSLAEFRKLKIPTVGVTVADEGGVDGFDALVSGRTSFMAALESAYVIADSKGTGKAVFLWLDGFPHEEQAIVVAERVFAECGGCELLETRNRTFSQAMDPVEGASVTNALVQKYGDRLEYLVIPGGLGAAYIVEALKAAGREDVKVISKNGDPERIGAVAAGDQEAEFGVLRGWNAYSAVDQVNRMLNGQSPVPDAEQAIPATMFVKDNAPADGVVDWSTFLDYEGIYTDLWKSSR